MSVWCWRTISDRANDLSPLDGMAETGLRSDDHPSRLWRLAFAPDEEHTVPHPTFTAPPGWPDIEEVNDVLDGYEVRELIGVGGMGGVYRAWQEKLDRDVAIKLIPLGNENGEWLAKRLDREAKIMAGLSHPNIVPVYDFNRDERHCWIVMEYVRGFDLSRILDGEPRTGEEVLDTSVQIASALSYAHSCGVVHRDIKPSNILIEADTGRVRVVDFGISRSHCHSDGEAMDSITRLTMTGTLLGTETYCAPELMQTGADASDADERSDLYGLGVLIYEMLTGHLPRGRFKLPSEFAAELASFDPIIEQCLAPDPGDRFPGAEELLDQLEEMPSDHWRKKSRFRSNRKSAGIRQPLSSLLNFHNYLLGAGIFGFFFLCVLLGSGDNRFSFLETATGKQFDRAVGLTTLTALFNLLWLCAVFVSWRSNRTEVSTFGTFACAFFVLFGNSLLVYLAVSD